MLSSRIKKRGRSYYCVRETRREDGFVATCQARGPLRDLKLAAIALPNGEFRGMIILEAHSIDQMLNHEPVGGMAAPHVPAQAADVADDMRLRATSQIARLPASSASSAIFAFAQTNRFVS